MQKSRISGILLGCILGFMPILILTIKYKIDGFNSALNLDSFYDFVYIVFLLLLPILFGGLAGYLLGASLYQELIKNSKLS